MFPRLKLALGLAMIPALAFAIPVFAGGWAVITLDELPVNATAGEPLVVGFTVLQHGRTPIPGLTPTVTLTLPKEKQVLVEAKEEGKPGHYSATLVFPKEGEWNWSVQAFSMDHPMPSIRVSAPAAVVETQRMDAGAPAAPLLIVRGLALAIGIVGLFFGLRYKNRVAMGITAICLVVGIGSPITGSTVPKAEAQKGAAPAVEEVSISQVEFGRRLFIAKGCITCHANSRAAKTGYWTVDMGAPDLSNFSASPEVLRLRLEDPRRVNSNTQMPDLNLSDAEIEALIAFINSK